MTLKTQIQSDMKVAMKARDADRLKVLRMLLAAIQQVEIDERRETDDAVVLAVLTKMVKQRRDSVDQYTSGGRDDLAAAERAEIDVLDAYLPEPLSDAELDELIDAAIAEAGATGPRDMGRVMGLIRDRVKARADMGVVSGRVKSRLAE